MTTSHLRVDRVGGSVETEVFMGDKGRLWMEEEGDHQAIH